jgi:hypothetical protein
MLHFCCVYSLLYNHFQTPAVNVNGLLGTKRIPFFYVWDSSIVVYTDMRISLHLLSLRNGCSVLTTNALSIKQNFINDINVKSGKIPFYTYEFLHAADVWIWQGYWVYFLELLLGMHQQYAGVDAGLSIIRMCSTFHYSVLPVFFKVKI